MPLSTPFGDNATSQCEIAAEHLLANLQSDSLPATDLAETIATALSHPTGFPDLADASVPGDIILFAFGKEVSDVEDVTRGVVRYAQQANLTDRQFQFLLPHETPSPVVELLKPIVAPLGDHAEIHVHQPHDQKANSFLTSTQENRAIILNRHLCDADVVIPVGVARHDGRFNTFGAFSSIYPTYSDIDSLKRWNSPLFVTRPQRRKRRTAEIEEIRQLLGISVNCLLFPARGGGYSHAVYGEASQVQALADQQLAEHWQPSVPTLAGAVIALVTGGQLGQTWENAARALANVEDLVRPGGAIILATEIRQRPGLAMAQMAESLEFTDFEMLMRKSRSEDAAIALQFAKTLSQCKIYFRSALSEEILDQLDLIPVESDDECRKICEHYQDVVVVHDAQCMSLRLAESGLPS
ncbi:hypothetical protein C5Y96_01695 [Blastopirellula marina]|uniref:LarA-like N-terminal domain-containing protein n=1 Tax=Blastopirellula marina TaxID=124 RepID=A0A2S8G7S5_9BACT|nr:MULTISPECIES: lactate racemase domain-containing protein [Pirellulaceae]PQO40311.1 hypothetical protein C5Y96_01695 [Blastopirellula marina]RCS55859.1 DUF2088 domain-containing protein [Bremerella cremea]